MPLETAASDSKLSIAKTNRKIAKPIMEKKRRARINASLNELKTLLVEVLQKEGCRHSSKMEKADILEMAVRHLKNLQKQQNGSASQTPTLRDSYPPAIPLEKFASALPPDCLPPEIKYLSQTTTDYKSNPQVNSPDSTTVTKPDTNRNILPAPQPVSISIASLTSQSQSIQPVMTQAANGEITVVLPQQLLTQVGTNNNGLILPVYTVPTMQSTRQLMSSAAMHQTTSATAIQLNVKQSVQQSPNSAFSQTMSTSNGASSMTKAPSSPVWRPW